MIHTNNSGGVFESFVLCSGQAWVSSDISDARGRGETPQVETIFRLGQKSGASSRFQSRLLIVTFECASQIVRREPKRPTWIERRQKRYCRRTAISGTRPELITDQRPALPSPRITRYLSVCLWVYKHSHMRGGPSTKGTSTFNTTFRSGVRAAIVYTHVPSWYVARTSALGLRRRDGTGGHCQSWKPGSENRERFCPVSTRCLFL